MSCITFEWSNSTLLRTHIYVFGCEVIFVQFCKQKTCLLMPFNHMNAYVYRMSHLVGMDTRLAHWSNILIYTVIHKFWYQFQIAPSAKPHMTTTWKLKGWNFSSSVNCLQSFCMYNTLLFFGTKTKWWQFCVESSKYATLFSNYFARMLWEVDARLCEGKESKVASIGNRFRVESSNRDTVAPALHSLFEKSLVFCDKTLL